VRIGVLESLEHLVCSGRLERAGVVLYFRERFNGKLKRTRSDLWDCLAGLAVELEAAELLPEIRRAYEDGLLSPEMNIEEIEECLREDKTSNERDQPGLIDDYFPLVNAHR